MLGYACWIINHKATKIVKIIKYPAETELIKLQIVFTKLIENVMFQELPAVLRDRCCFYGLDTSTQPAFYALQFEKQLRIT